MTFKPVVLRETAQRDVSSAVDDLLERGAGQAATRFVDALQTACRGIAHHPAAGSSRYAPEVGLPGLRHWELPGQDYYVFYREFGDHVDVWRVLSKGRDIPGWMGDGW